MSVSKTLARIGFFVAASTATSSAVILYGAENTANLTSAGTGAPFASVARVYDVANPDGSGGSGVYLGNGFMLTAHHIPNAQLNTVTFDSSTFYSRDLSYIPQQIGNTDLKIFKLSSLPSVSAVNLYDGSSELSQSATLVGFGRGRAAGQPINTNIVQIAGGGTPLLKRWGTNTPNRTITNFTYTQSSVNYAFDALETTLGNTGGNPSDDGTGPFEAAATPRDSGSGFFQQIGGTWYLTGLTSAILQQNSGRVTYGNDVSWSGTTPLDYSAPAGTGDPNVFVRISSYADDINALIIPEPSSSLLVGIASLLIVGYRRR